MYSTLPTHFRAYNNVQLIIHSSRVWNSTKVQIYLTDVQTLRCSSKAMRRMAKFCSTFSTYYVYSGAPCEGERGWIRRTESIGRIYICMSAGGTMYSNCEKKGWLRIYVYIYAYRWWIKNATDWLTKRDGPLNGAEWDAGTFLASFSTRSLYMRLRNTVCALTRRI